MISISIVLTHITSTRLYSTGRMEKLTKRSTTEFWSEFWSVNWVVRLYGENFAVRLISSPKSRHGGPRDRMPPSPRYVSNTRSPLSSPISGTFVELWVVCTAKGDGGSLTEWV